jgi:PII-like signaling protein
MVAKKLEVILLKSSYISIHGFPGVSLLSQWVSHDFSIYLRGATVHRGCCGNLVLLHDNALWELEEPLEEPLIYKN